MEEIKRINMNSIPNRIILTRIIFLKLLSFIYLIAFIGLYGQIQGLWGDEGIFPANLYLEKIKETFKEKAIFLNFPTLAWYIEKINIPLKISFLHFGSNVENFLFIICIIGILISLLILLNYNQLFDSFGFFILWYIYLNFYILGQNIIKFEWDNLLLETGFLSIIFAPSNYKKNINIITLSNNISFYLLRFLLFKVMICIGINIMLSDCPYWLSFNGFNFFFQSQPLLSNLSYYAHFFSNPIKKSLSAWMFFCVLYLPFAYFLIWRRFNIFSGQITFFFHFFITLFGNYSFYNLLILTLNILNFDDYFIRGILHEKILYYLKIDSLTDIVIKYIKEKEKEDEEEMKEEEKLEKKKKEIEKKIKEKGKESEEEKKEIENLYKEIRKKKWNLYDYSEYPKVEESLNSETSLIREFFIFINLSCLTMLIVFLYLFPLKNLLGKGANIQSLDSENVKSFLDIYSIFIFIYILFIFFYDIASGLKNILLSSYTLNPFDDEEEENKKKKTEKDYKKMTLNILSYIISGTKIFFILTIIIIYFIGSLNSLYQSLNINLVEEDENIKEKEKELNLESPSSGIINFGLTLSNIIFQRFSVFGKYGTIQREILGTNGRSELEIEYTTNINKYKYEEINFMFKTGKKNIPKFNFFYLPRLDWQINYSAYSPDINSDPYLVVLLGKIFEKNPIILDLLGYIVDEKEFIYKNSFFDRIKNYYLKKEKDEIVGSIEKIKVDVFHYMFIKDNKAMFKRKRYQEFLLPIEKYSLQPIFQKLNLPKIDFNREKHINSFQLIPIVDIVIIIILIKFLMF